MPRLLGVDMDARVLILQELVGAESLASLYSNGALTEGELRQLAEYLGALHQATRGPADPTFSNWEMRQLNHHHIFEFPLAENHGLDLEQFERGLTAVAETLRLDTTYRGIVRYTGRRVLEAGPVLIHGDFFPGSWLKTPSGIFVIDPEFCFYGDAEFDLGCAIAHLRLAQQPCEYAEAFLQAYSEHPGVGNVQASLLTCFATAEVMRRLIGVAQLPLAATMNRAKLLDQSRRAMIGQAWEELWNGE